MAVDSLLSSFKTSDNHLKVIPLETEHATSDALESYLHRVKNEITRVEQLAGQLHQEASRLKAHINEISSSVSHLPVEILSEIFTYAAPYDARPEIDTKPQLLSPFFLGAVCKRWREIAWTTPTIWTNVSVFLSRASRYPIQVELLQDWLKRSGGLPLTIKLVWNARYPFADENWTSAMTERDDPKPIIDLLLTYASRWEVIDFFLAISWYHHFENCGFQCPLLKSAALRRRDWPNEQVWTSLDILAGSPKLRELQLANFRSSDLSLAPWSSLDTLVVFGNTVADTGYILSEASNVQDICLCDIDGDVTSGANQETDITLPKLDSLTITDSSGPALRQLIDRLSLPKIEDLHISTQISDAFNDFDLRLHFDFRNFERWSKAWSSTLTMINIDVSLTETAHLIQGLSSLKSVQVVKIKNFGHVPLDMFDFTSSLVTKKIMANSFLSCADSITPEKSLNW
ncbi:hypothetical protein BDQ17DRAFT_371811 [Cyathus striatus]|nr:hypothetical protein BDQ17DRAFT_371811 [Cyathus striatus]